jgi:anti-sigma factor RsiW
MMAYLDEQLDGDQRDTLEEHVSRCFGCLGFLLKAKRKREAFNRAVKDTLGEGRTAPAKLREEVKVCLNCLTAPGSVRCPRLKLSLRLVPAPPKDV